MTTDWASLSGKPFVTVSPTGGGTPPNNGADYGPDTLLNNVGPGKTVTSGIQEAILALPSAGGTVCCLAGSYSISASLYNTGNYQVVEFSAGAILNFSSSGTYESSDLNGASDILVGTQRTPSELNFHDCYWLGNGAQIVGSGLHGTLHEQIFAAQHSKAATSAPGYKLVVEGFTISNIGNISFILSSNNYATGVTYTQQIRQVRFSRISATWYTGLIHSNGASGFLVHGSARQVLIEDCLLDASAVNGSPLPDLSNCFIHANAGDTTQVVVRRSLFLQPVATGACSGNAGSCWELQGDDSVIDAHRKDAHRISIEGCVFDSGRSAQAVGGCGGGYIDDYDSNSGDAGYIKEVVFRRTHLVNVSSNYRAHTAQVIGELSFSDGTLLLAEFPQQTPPGGLPYRIPGDSGQSQTVPSTGPFSYTNLNGFRVTIVVNGGTGVAITINGIVVGPVAGAFQVDHGETLAVTYSATHPPSVQVLSLT